MPNFLFVNRNQTSAHLTGGKASEASAIQHFVQKGRKRARKGRLVSAFKADPLPVKAANEPPSTNEGKKDLETVQKCQSSAQTASIRSPQVARRDSATSVRTARLSRRDSATSVRTARLSLPPLCCNISSATDPFQVTATTIDTGVRNLINYYTTFYHPTLWPNETLALRRGGYIFENAVNHVVQASLQDSLAMYCLLAASVSRMRHVDHLPLPEATSSRENQYMNQALYHMQERINQAAEHPGINLLYLLTPMVFLSSAEAYRDDTRASKTHLEACMSLLEYHNMGVMDVADPNLQGQLLMSDLFISCVNVEECLFRADDYDPGSVEAIDLQPCELDPLPYELILMATSLFHNYTISFEVRSLISQIWETYSTRRSLNTTTMTSTRATKTTHWITKRNMAIRNRLLSVFSYPETEANSVSADEWLEKALRIVLVQFTLLSMNITGRIKTVKVMSRQLQRFLEPLLPARSDSMVEGKELLLWLVVVGYSCAQVGTENEDWFAGRCRELMDDCGIRRNPTWDGDWDDQDDILPRLEQIQNRYFYHAPVQRPRLRKLIDGTVALTSRLETSGDGISTQRSSPHR